MFGPHFGLSNLAGRRRSATFSPASVSGLIAWYDPSDLSTLFQDSAMTVPVTSDGDPVGAMLDKSGNGYHAVQVTANERPIYREDVGISSLEFDGSATYLTASAVGMGGSDEVCLAASVTLTDQSSIRVVCEHSASSSSNSGTFGLFDRGVSANSVSWRSKGSASSLLTAARTASTPVTSVYVCSGKISTDFSELRRNGAILSGSTADQGSGSFGDHAFYIGARGGSSLHFEGHMYGLCLFNRVQAAPVVEQLEDFLEI